MKENRKIYHKLYNRNRREKLPKNICPVCCKREKLNGYSMCEKCRETQIKYREKLRGIYNNVRR